MTSNFVGPRRPRVLPVVTVAMAALIACQPGPPLNLYDPPPTFAIHYTLQSTGLYAPGVSGTGSSLLGAHVVDLVDSTFTTTGSTYSFHDWVAFSDYRVVSGARWPARWSVTSTAGCGAGTGDNVDVRRAIVELVCVPRQAPVFVSPGSFNGLTPPSALTLSFNTGDTPPSTTGTVYILNESVGEVVGQQGISIDSNGNAYVAAPYYDGYHRVVVHFDGYPNGYEVAETTFEVYGNPYPCSHC